MSKDEGSLVGGCIEVEKGFVGFIDVVGDTSFCGGGGTKEGGGGITKCEVEAEASANCLLGALGPEGGEVSVMVEPIICAGGGRIPSK